MQQNLPDGLLGRRSRAVPADDPRSHRARPDPRPQVRAFFDAFTSDELDTERLGGLVAQDLSRVLSQS
jgi:hypothetical protein